MSDGKDPVSIALMKACQRNEEYLDRIKELEDDLKKTRAGLHLSSQNLAEIEAERDKFREALEKIAEMPCDLFEHKTARDALAATDEVKE